MGDQKITSEYSGRATIVLFAVDAKMFEYLEDYIGDKYNLFAIDHFDDFDLFEHYKNIQEARLSLFQYIEGFYNRKRRHSHLGNISPLKFEEMAA